LRVGLGQSGFDCAVAQHKLGLTILHEDLALTGWDGRRVVLPGTYHMEFEGASDRVHTAELKIANRTLVEPPLPTPFPSHTSV
jgi:hypothetical protein